LPATTDSNIEAMTKFKLRQQIIKSKISKFFMDKRYSGEYGLTSHPGSSLS